MMTGIDAAAFALFAKQAREWDIPEAGALIEWSADPQLRNFWRDQVRTVLEALAS